MGFIFLLKFSINLRRCLIYILLSYLPFYLFLRFSLNAFPIFIVLLIKFENCPGLRIVKKEENFIQLMYSSDVVVLDYPSTTLLQSLAAGLPVFVLMKYWDYPEKARSLLNLRAVLADEPGKLIEQLKLYIGGNKYTPSLEDSSFLMSYGTYIGDKKSGDRVMTFIFRESKLRNASL